MISTNVPMTTTSCPSNTNNTFGYTRCCPSNNSNSNNNSKNDNNNDDDDDTPHYPTGATVPFPYAKPYEQQVALMDALLEGIQNTTTTTDTEEAVIDENSKRTATTLTTSFNHCKILCLESPTGTGKSLSLACASLAWLEYMEQQQQHLQPDHEHQQQQLMQQERSPLSSAASRTFLASSSTATVVITPQTISKTATSTNSASSNTPSTGLSWLDDWKPPLPDADEQARKDNRRRQHEQEERKRHQQLLETLDAIRSEWKTTAADDRHNRHDSLQPPPSPKSIRSQTLLRRDNLIRQAVTKAKVVARKRQRQLQQQRQRQPIVLDYEREDEEADAALSFLSDDDDDDDDDGSRRSDSAFTPMSTRQRRNRMPSPTPGSAEWLLEAPRRWSTTTSTSRRTSSSSSHITTAATTGAPSLSTTTAPIQATPNIRQPRIIYAARTHSQLSQFIGEVRKTKWGETTRVVALGSRSQGLCGYLTTPSKKSSSGSNGSNGGVGSKIKLSEANLTEQCLELRQSKKRPSSNTANGGGATSTCACPYYQPSAIATLALQSLAAPTDLEDMVRWGQATQTCAYYATRKAMAQAQLIVVPYSVLLDAKTRESTGLQLQDALVLIDEAHNLPQAIEGVTSARLGLSICQAALRQVQRYTKKYLLEQDRLNARHAQLLGQLKTILKVFIKCLLLTTTSTNNNTNDVVPPRVSYDNCNSKKDTEKKRKTLLSISQFLCEYRLDSINLFPLLRYLQDTRLSQKLLGFMKEDPSQPDPTMNGTGPSTCSTLTTKTVTLSSHISPMSIVESFLNKMNTYDAKHAKIVVNRTTTNITTTEEEGGEEACLELVVLNPAVHAQDDLYTLPHAVCLVGGTLQPFNILMQELVPSLTLEASKAQAMIQRNNYNYSSKKTQSFIRYQSASFVGFSCGHVVSPDHVLLQALTQVGSTTLDIRHATRSTPAMCQAIGLGILEVCRVVPHGVVVFLPSYSYERVLVQAWKTLKICHNHSTTTTTIWDAIQQVKPIFREPKQRMDMEATLQEFARAAESSSVSHHHHNANAAAHTTNKNTSGRGGALLLAVVGGKLSEGINFADRLCRCVVVVGLPYADQSDPVLQEKLRYLDNKEDDDDGTTAGLNRIPGGSNATTNTAAPCAVKKTKQKNSSYYQSLCLRAVNQSVGRAIRHAQDFAAIVVMDVRYPRNPEIAHGLPQWLTSSTPTWRQQDGRLEAVTRRLCEFFQNPTFAAAAAAAAVVAQPQHNGCTSK